MAKQKTLTELIEGLTWFNDVEKSKEIFRKLNAKAGSTDYIENVQVSGSTMTFTGVGNAFSGDVTLPSGGGGGTPLEVYSESGTLAGGDAEATIGDFNAQTSQGSGLIYEQKNQGTLYIYTKSVIMGGMTPSAPVIEISDSYGIIIDSTNEIVIGDTVENGNNTLITIADSLEVIHLQANNGILLSKENNGIYARLNTNEITDIRSIEIPNKSGTISLENEEYTVSTLPSAPARGDKAFITDATSPTYLGIAVGGGSVFCEVMYNGTAWVTK